MRATLIIQCCMSCFQMVLEADNISLPSLYATFGNHPDLFGNLINKPKIMTYKHQATIPLCSAQVHIIVSCDQSAAITL